MLSFDSGLTNALKNSNTTAFWVLKLYYNDESAFIGVSDQHRQDGSDIYYGIVANWGVYRQSLDFFNFTTTIGNMSVTLINSENSIKGGRFSDLLATNNFVNRKWELFLNTNETSTLDTAARMIASGVISGDINYDSNNTTLTLFDNTSRRHKRIPTNTVESSTYTNAPANNVGKPIPMAYGDFYEKTDIGTIPTSHFDLYYNFYKGAFPAIITDKWDVQEEGSLAKADYQAVNAMDDENIYIYKNGQYPTLTGTNVVSANPTIEYKGSSASVFIPLSSSNQASASGDGTGQVQNPTSAVDGDFSSVSTFRADGASEADSDIAINYAVPKINKLGDYTGVSSLIKFGTSTIATDSDSDDTFVIGGSIAFAAITADSEVKTSISSLFATAKQESFDFEKTLQFKLNSGTSDELLQIYNSGIVVDFTLEDIEPHDIQELYEGGPIKSVVQLGQGPPETLELGYDHNIYTRTITGFTPSKIDYIYYSGKGRQYGAYIDADNRGSGESGDNGYATNAVIENPIFIIESILRSELGTIYTGSGTSTTSNKLVDSNASFATSVVGQTVYNITDKTSAMVTARDSATTLSLDTNIMASGENYIIGGLTSDEIDYASFDTAGNTTNGYLGDIYEDAVSDVKFAFAQYKFINSKDMFERLGRLCFSYVFVGGDGKFKIKTLRRTDDYSSSDQTIDFHDIDLGKIGKTSLGNVKNSILVNYNHDYGANQNKSEATATDSTSQGTTVDGFNQTMKLEIEANEILDSTTATKLAEALLAFMKDRKNTVEFTCLRPKYNHLEIGDIIDFSNWDSDLKIYGQTMGGSWDSTTNTFSSVTTTWDNMAAGYFIVADITKTVNGCSIKAIKVS
tara:strand:+ start:6 stop:2573 length:2568 start_codon:yes stop_codon:yes gene_type:complete